MPARRKYPIPPAQMGERLRAALVLGQEFDPAWEAAFWTLKYPHAVPEREDWQEALLATKPAWRAAYAREMDEVERIFSAMDPLNGSIELQAVA